MNKIDVPAFTAALERYLAIFRRGESAIDGIRSELHMIRDDSMLPIYREAIDAVTLQLTVAELALEAMGWSVEALWKVQKAKESQDDAPDVDLCPHCKHERGAWINEQQDSAAGADLGVVCNCGCHFLK
jgi:hypothetical protein